MATPEKKPNNDKQIFVTNVFVEAHDVQQVGDENASIFSSGKFETSLDRSDFEDVEDWYTVLKLLTDAARRKRIKNLPAA
jgi:hypothetical protein